MSSAPANVLEAATLAGCKRVVFASSGATVAGWEREEPYRALVEGRYDDVPADWLRIRHDMATRSNGLYGSTKIWGEALARGTMPTAPISPRSPCASATSTPEDRPVNARSFSVWCSQRDVVNAIERAVDLDESVRYDIFFVQSDNKWGYRDLSHGAEVLGFSPQDAAGGPSRVNARERAAVSVFEELGDVASGREREAAGHKSAGHRSDHEARMHAHPPGTNGVDRGGHAEQGPHGEAVQAS